jgi:hypothetical protein
MKQIKWQKARNKNCYTVVNFPFFSIIVWFSDFNSKQAALKYCLERLDSIQFSHTTWCNNNGNGKYVTKKRLFNKYQWLEAGWNVKSSISKRHAIRFTIETPYETVIKTGEKIMNRHKKRFVECLINN